MCPNCFEQEIPRFDSEAEFNEFEHILGLKRSLNEIGKFPDDPGKPKFKIFGIAFYGDTWKSGYTILQCNECKQRWKLSPPDYAWRGFFIKEESSEIAH